MLAMESQAWSCSSLEAGVQTVQNHFEALRAQSLSEEQMTSELEVRCLNSGVCTSQKTRLGV